MDGCRIHGCPVETSLELISGKWKPRLLWKLHQNGVMRFGELKRELPDITPKMLTQQLRELERDGLVTRTVYAEVPPRVEYSLSELGDTLRPVLDTIAAWGTRHQPAIVAILAEQT
ncbi:MAG: helix-turn-helix transcriptional regulator [Caldilineaceae bacterium]|nr:helix-turn-helix transcriptional regulator [Caldilineaceae bacterium]